MPYSTVVSIDLSAVHHNMTVFRRMVGPEVQICPIVKANAYGLGARRLSKRLVSSGAAMLAVYTVEQAAEVVAAVPHCPALVLMPVWAIERSGEIYRSIVAGRVHLSVHGGDHLNAITSIARGFGCCVPVHIEVDTGMSRGGVSISEAEALLDTALSERWVRLAGLYTHFASAERDRRETDRQMKEFSELLDRNASRLPANCLIHAANTAATLRDPRYHRQLVRIGLGWAGYGGETIEDGEFSGLAAELTPAVTWQSSIVHVKSIETAARVGYGGTWHAARPSRIGLVPVGYADGYPVGCGSDHTIHRPVHVAVFSGTPEEPQRFDAPVIGAVNMDQITVDLTDLPQHAARLGARVEIYSPDRGAANHLPTVAQRIGTPPHELLSRISPRVPRRYTMQDALGVRPQPAVTGHRA